MIDRAEAKGPMLRRIMPAWVKLRIKRLMGTSPRRKRLRVLKPKDQEDQGG